VVKGREWIECLAATTDRQILTPRTQSRWAVDRPVVTIVGLVWAIVSSSAQAGSTLEVDYAAVVRPALQKYCLSCHSTKLKKGSLDLERFVSVDVNRKDLKAWQQTLEMLEVGEMPPTGKPQPSAEERKAVVAWARGFLDAEARARAGDPGHVPLRRLSNSEYDRTIRDLTGIDLRPAREFPADGAAGEGFTNAAEGLTEISPALLTKYLNAAKEVAEHAVLLPDGFRFSVGKTRREWINESVAGLRQFYAKFTPDGRLPLQPYLAATVRHRDAVLDGKLTLDTVARQEKLNRKYLDILWRTLTDSPPSQPLDAIREHWRRASEKDIDALAAEIRGWQDALWRSQPIGSYRYGNVVRDVTNDPQRVEPPPVKVGPPSRFRWDGKSPVTLTPEDYQQLLHGFTEFRHVFPRFVCFAEVIPTDEAVSLKMFHREDEPLERMFLNAERKRHIDYLWTEHRFISRQPLAENAYLPQFIGYVTQDQPKELLAYFEGQRPVFQKRADDFQKELDAAVPGQLQALLRFAEKAYRRPLSGKESCDLLNLHQSARKKGADHEEAFRAALARTLVAPAFLFKIENAPPGKEPRPVSDWELATRLSYFLWGTLPDDELRAVAAAATLHEPAVLAEQTRRMLKDGRVRGLAVEFGTQWLHVRDFDQFNEKNEKLFPTFNAELRAAMNEEAVRFFWDLFQSDRSIADVLDCDYTFVNGTLARHYGINGVDGPEWCQVHGVKQNGRGGILGLAAVQAKQSGASRTSPVLRGNWVVETLLGEKLPRPPPNVPKLPEEETAGDGLTTRQRVEAHAKDAACAVCHVRIDPFGFALEHYDAIGRRRDFDSGGRPVDTHARLKDGTEFDGIDGLRKYLLTKKRDVFVRLFCRKLLGYSLGRSVTLSDTALLDEMVNELQKNDGRLSAAILTIVRSPQFRMIRGLEYID
jgi:hypothetical protein